MSARTASFRDAGNNSDTFDIVIVGGGIVGLTLANELIDTEFSVALVERSELKPVNEEPDCRVSAINRIALQRYSQTGVFDSPLAERLCAFEKMFVWDQTGAGQIQFDSAELGVPELGAIVENNVLQQMLLKRVLAAGNIHYLCPQEITDIHYPVSEDALLATSLLRLASGREIRATLLVAADGVHSRVRAAAGIEHFSKAYQQQGLVCNVTTSEKHQHTAWQCFMPSGPLAFLPLFTGQCSIVWSLDEEEAQQLMSLENGAFSTALAEAAQYKLGEIRAVGQRYLFPLSHGHVQEYVKPGLALIGDAAHNIHPLAGQGANLGIADAFALAEVLLTAKKAKRQWSALHTLSKYQRRRKGANQIMENSMTGFKELFGNNNTLVSEIRNAGLLLIDSLPAVKYRIIKQALGV